MYFGGSNLNSITCKLTLCICSSTWMPSILVHLFLCGRMIILKNGNSHFLIKSDPKLNHFGGGQDKNWLVQILVSCQTTLPLHAYLVSRTSQRNTGWKHNNGLLSAMQPFLVQSKAFVKYQKVRIILFTLPAHNFHRIILNEN